MPCLCYVTDEYRLLQIGRYWFTVFMFVVIHDMF